MSSPDAVRDGLHDRVDPVDIALDVLPRREIAGTSVTVPLAVIEVAPANSLSTPLTCPVVVANPHIVPEVRFGVRGPTA
jgi:hypothetical protein